MVGATALALNLAGWTSTSRAVSKVTLLELLPHHVSALLTDPDLGPELSKYSSSYTVRTAQGRALASSATDRRGVAAAHAADEKLRAELKALNGPEARRARMQLLRSMAVTFKFTCVNVVQLLGCGVFQEAKVGGAG